ncbi:probable C-mannosyltransferase DPY19L1 isoform X1 [Diachasma alloeum]|uniref:probable C-mannosyltransferase DPY19L1 isoform X1 n=1 Tax=Diachasma alloeum TaxID=454923 RepID=UPI0007383270|nr:probable C-mannosyltransferase DPY19L1 isoform X1 [Diachasma alloeum]
MAAARIAYILLLVFLSLGFGLLHRWHVSTLFENDRHFSHLSEMEREMSFRTEMGMYYYYYKLMIEAPSWQEGLDRLRSDNLSQFPKVINADRTYNLFPEIYAGTLYRFAESLGLLGEPQCWQTERGDGLSSVMSCQGLSVPSYFYIAIVWSLAMMTGSVLFLYATYLSGSIYGGLIAILAFFFNHTECTRVQWTPPLRESFAYPLLLFQMFRVTMFLDKYSFKKKKLTWRNILWDNPYTDIFIVTKLCLFTWQFSQFIFTIQVIILLILQWLRIIPRYVTLYLLFHHIIAIAFTFYQGPMVVNSMYTCLVVGATYVNLMNAHVEGLWNPYLLLFSDVIGTIGSARFMKSAMIDYDDYHHIYNLLRSKLSGFRDFHTMLYTCSPEFDFLPYETYEIIVKTFLLPTAILAGFLAVYYWYRNFKARGYPECIEPGTAYNGLQTGAFIVMAFLVMRLKLFMTPHLCIIAGMVASRKYLAVVGIKRERLRLTIFVTLVAIMAYHGAQRVQEERQFYGEYSNIEQEQLFDWINANTPKNAVFAGKMSIMANLLLSTERAIVNNPYYESTEMRDRTLKVYEIYSRKDAAAVYETLRKMQVDYLILDEGNCYGLGAGKSGCRMVDLWDISDNGRAKRLGKRPLCPILYSGNAHPFRRVFANNHYVVLRLDYSTYVELKPKTPILMQS